MTTTPEDNRRENPIAADRPCASCGHTGEQHVVHEVELSGRTVHETYCEGCVAFCDYLPQGDA